MYMFYFCYLITGPHTAQQGGQRRARGGADLQKLLCRLSAHARTGVVQASPGAKCM